MFRRLVAWTREHLFKGDAGIDTLEVPLSVSARTVQLQVEELQDQILRKRAVLHRMREDLALDLLRKETEKGN